MIGVAFYELDIGKKLYNFPIFLTGDVKEAELSEVLPLEILGVYQFTKTNKFKCFVTHISPRKLIITLKDLRILIIDFPRPFPQINLLSLETYPTIEQVKIQGEKILKNKLATYKSLL